MPERFGVKLWKFRRFSVLPSIIMLVAQVRWTDSRRVTPEESSNEKNYPCSDSDFRYRPVGVYRPGPGAGQALIR